MKQKYAMYKTKVGYLQIGYLDERITSISKVINPSSSKDEPSALTDRAAKQINEYLKGIRMFFDIPISYEGTPFQNKVWHELLNIPYGETRTYQEIAVDIGNPKACRAVGMACNKNPIAIAIPCHRVIGKNKKLTGYAGGLDMKRFLLKL